MKVYLAGPINGCTDDEAINWRELAKRSLGAANCLDPMRRDYRGREDRAVAEIVEGDKGDIRQSHLVLANCWQASWGTAMEIAYAYDQSVPVFAVVSPGARVSPWLRYHAHIFDSLTEALEAIR